jgi:hypothetical protein
VTILRSNQYQGLASFTQVGTFVPLCRDRHGMVTREVASARFALPAPDHPDQTLRLSVALIRDWRTQVPLVPTPAAPTEPKLTPIVTTTASCDPVELVQIYARRWPTQENSLRDFLVSFCLFLVQKRGRAPSWLRSVEALLSILITSAQCGLSKRGENQTFLPSTATHSSQAH